MKTRVWIFALLVIAALAANLVLLSRRIASTAEAAMNLRRTDATTGLRAQIDLIDARLPPRLVATSPELLDALKAPADVTQPMPKPDEKALRAALSAAAFEPDLLIVASSQGAAMQRKGKGPAQVLPAAQVGSVPLAKSIMEGARPKPSFTRVDGTLYRLAGAPMPQSAGAVVVGTAIDDALAARLGALIDAQITFFEGGRIAASSAKADERGQLQEWIKHPSPGYGVLPVNLYGKVDLTGRLPIEADKQAWRTALLPLDGGVQAAISVPAGPYLGWLGRYQALYLAALAGLFLFALIWGLIPGRKPVVVAAPPPAREPVRPRGTPITTPQPIAKIEKERPRSDPEFMPVEAKPKPASELPWTPSESEEPAGWDHLGESRAAASAKRDEAPLVVPGTQQEAAPIELPSRLPPPPPPAALKEADGADKPRHEELELVEAHPEPQAASASEPHDGALPVLEGEAGGKEKVPGELHLGDTLSDGEPLRDEAKELPPRAEALAEAWPEPEAGKAGEAGEAWSAPSNDKAADSWAAPEGKGEAWPEAAADKGEDAWAGASPQAGEKAPEKAGDEALDIAGANAEEKPAEPAQKPQEFSFAGLLDEANEAAATAPPEGPKPSQPVSFGTETRDVTSPGQPSAALLAQTRGDVPPGGYFPGDEPTRIEPVSAALLDKLRETDENEKPRTVEHAPEKAAAQAAASDEPMALKDIKTDKFAKVSTTDESTLDEERGPAREGWPSDLSHEAAPHPEPARAEPPADTAPQPDELQRALAEASQAVGDSGPSESAPADEQQQEAPPEAPAEPPAEPLLEAPSAPRMPRMPRMAEAEGGSDITLSGLQMPRLDGMTAAEGGDPDEAHWRDTFQKFVQTRAQTGEPSERLSYEKFAAKLRKNREDLLARHHCRGVRFQVYVKEGKAAIKASAIK